MFFSKVLFALGAICSALVEGATYTDPLKNPNGSDPFIVWDGTYYHLMTTTWDNIQITRAKTLNGLKNGETKTVWSDSTASRCCNVWAPEVHYFDGHWYIYYTAGNKDNLDGQRIHVLRGGGSPFDTYSYVRQVTSAWGIDATIFRTTSANYLVYSCQSGGLQSLCAAKLGSDYSSIGSSSVISQPTESWERIGGNVNEGPAAMYHGGVSYLAYSASYCWSPSYQLGLLTWNGADPLKASSWSKSGPVFSTANGNYGTGHNGFFNSPDNTEIWNVYHATSNSAGACDGNRYTMAKVVNWNSNGRPNFGRAEKLGTTLQGPSGE